MSKSISTSLKNRKIDEKLYLLIRNLLLDNTQSKVAKIVGLSQPMICKVKGSKDYDRFSNRYELSFNKPGYLYLVESGIYHKMGVTTNLISRIYTYESHNPNVLFTVSGLIDEAGYIENELHKKFFNQRAIRDWYILNKENIDYIKNVLSSGKMQN